MASSAMTKAVAGHMRFVSDTGTRYDDTVEGQLGDVYRCHNATITIAPIFGSRRRAGDSLLSLQGQQTPVMATASWLSQ